MSDQDVEIELVRREIALEDYRAHMEEANERLRYQVEFSQSALKNLHLVNGGAILALLTFLGNAHIKFNYQAMLWSFGWFAGGLILSLTAYFGAYFSQAYYMQLTAKQAWNAQSRARGGHEPYDFKAEYKVGNIFLYGAILAAVLSLACFVIGAFVGLGALA